MPALNKFKVLCQQLSGSVFCFTGCFVTEVPLCFNRQLVSSAADIPPSFVSIISLPILSGHLSIMKHTIINDTGQCYQERACSELHSYNSSWKSDSMGLSKNRISYFQYWQLPANLEGNTKIWACLTSRIILLTCQHGYFNSFVKISQEAIKFQMENDSFAHAKLQAKKCKTE